MTGPDPAIRFLRFEYYSDEPGGFDNDCTGRFATLGEALKEPSSSECRDVYDTWTGEWHEIAQAPIPPREPYSGPRLEDFEVGSIGWQMCKRRIEADREMVAVLERCMWGPPLNRATIFGVNP